MRCWRCKSEMPEGLKYCGNCGVHMNRAVHVFQWLFSKKGLPVLIVVLALIIGAAAWFIIPKLRVPTIEFDLDMGWYTPSEDDIVYHDDSKTFGYVNNMILVFFTKDATAEEITEVVRSVDGEVVGILQGVRQYQIRVPARTEEELEQLRKELMEFEVVKNAVIDYVATAEGETAAIPNDPWADPAGYGLTAEWDEENPSGTNWWIEASHILSAWEYQSKFSNISVGVVDSGFDPNHEDLDITILNPEHNNAGQHGTHVVGIIGATANNGIGITGVVQDANLYCVDCAPTDEQVAQNISVSSMYASIDMCIMNGCRVVNLSRGLIFNSREQNEAAAERTSRSALENLIMMLDSYDEDFIIVKSAGNASVESRYSGYYAAITEDLVREVLERMKADGVKFEEELTVEDVMNSMMVVGAVDYYRTNGQYQLATFSNYGDLLTVCAPGCLILSTVPEGDDYEYLQGTSMATPIVTGVAAMVWSVDPTMTAGEVKEIIVSTATEPVLPRTSGDNGSYYMINAAAAVEKALALLAEKATEPSEPAQTGGPDKLMPYFDRYVGSSHYTIETSSLVTSGSTDERYYWDVGSVDLEAAPYVDSYMELLLEDTYQLELIYENDGEYYFTYTGSADVDTLGKHDGMSREMDNCHLWIKLSENTYTITFERWCSAEFDFVEVHPSESSVIADDVKLLAQVRTYWNGNLHRTDTLHYDSGNRMTGVTIALGDIGITANASFTYDGSGRLVFADYDDCWVYFGNNEYIYNDQGQLTSYRYYWGGGELPYGQYDYEYDADGTMIRDTASFPNFDNTALEVSSVMGYVYQFDDQGRVTEQAGWYEYLDSDFSLGTDLGTYPATDYVYINRYTYDSQGRLAEKQILHALKDTFVPGGIMEVSEAEIQTYNYDFSQFVLIGEGSGDSYQLAITDEEGHTIWAIGIGNDLTIDQDGCLVEATDAYGEYRYEFVYRTASELRNPGLAVDPDQALSDFLQLRQYSTDFYEIEPYLEPQSYCLLDIDGNGTEELIILSESEDTGFYAFQVYGYDTSTGTVSRLPIQNSDVGSDYGWSYGEPTYSARFKALVFSSMRPFQLAGGKSFFCIDGNSLSSIGGAGWDIKHDGGNEIYYFSSFNGERKEITEQEKDDYIINEPQSITFLLLP